MNKMRLLKAKLLEDRTILNDFLKTWPLERICEMKLDEYVSTGNPDTFCQWVETKTRSLGSIKGLNSIKFGIYKRGNKDKRPQKATSDDSHSWLSYYGKENREKQVAFERIREDVVRIIENAHRLDLEAIDDIHLHNIFKWKVAFLYSNEGFIPIYKKEAIHMIAKSLGMNITKKTIYSEIHCFIASTKPLGISVYDYMRELYFKYKKSTVKTASSKKRTRKGAKNRNTNSQVRKGTTEYVAQQFHNELQEILKRYLSDKYGKDNVILEENYVDIKVSSRNEIWYYEVKTAPYAETCIKQGLGQLLSYMFYEKDKRSKKLIIFGKKEPTKPEKDYIKYLKHIFNNNDIDFDYQCLADIKNTESKHG